MQKCTYIKWMKRLILIPIQEGITRNVHRTMRLGNNERISMSWIGMRIWLN